MIIKWGRTNSTNNIFIKILRILWIDTLQKKVYKMLQGDAKLNESGKLGNLLGMYGTSPYGIYFNYPKVEVATPYIIFRESGSNNKQEYNLDSKVIESTYEFIIMSNSFDDIEKRLFQLFDRKIITGITGYKMLKCFRLSVQEDKWDEYLRSYVKAVRYKFTLHKEYTT